MSELNRKNYLNKEMVYAMQTKNSQLLQGSHIVKRQYKRELPECLYPISKQLTLTL